MSLEDYSAQQIASHQGVTDRTVRRRVALVRRIWFEEGDRD
jgi:hypothetical protein